MAQPIFLVLDDYVETGELITEMCECCFSGIEAWHVEEVKVAKEYFLEHKDNIFLVLVSDFFGGMGKANHSVEWLKSQGYSGDLVCMYSSPKLSQEMLAAGCRIALERPFGPEGLLRCISEALQRFPNTASPQDQSEDK